MKIIGEKLSNQELLSVKGGACMFCHCHDGTGAWYGDYSDPQDIIDALLTYCSGTTGQCNASQICDPE
ncbi:hypothetical protein ACV07N_13475 [Roseivirga echinicomitans]